jgi:hypothetical protein
MHCNEQHPIIRQIFISKWSSFYAMAVIELGAAVKANRALTVTKSGE